MDSLSNPAKEYFINMYKQEILDSLDTFCPITYKPFTFDNPPYKAEGCCHHFSLEGISQLKVHRHSEREGAAFLICPKCRGNIYFATIDLHYQRHVTFYNALQELEIKDKDSAAAMDFVKKEIELLRTRNQTFPKTFPKLLEPLGGIIGVLNALVFQSRHTFST